MHYPIPELYNIDKPILYNQTMTKRQKRELQERFFRQAGPNIDVVRRMFEHIHDYSFYIIDKDDLIIASNPRNLENGNFKDELEIVGKTCAEAFPSVFAEDYMRRDREVRRTGRPIIERTYSHAADYSTDLRIASVFPLRDRRGRIIGTATFHRAKPCGDEIPDWYGRIRGAVTYIDRHYADKLTLRKLAANAGLSQVSFSRLFKKITGTTPRRYITENRLNRSRKLLKDTDMLLADIAAETGFYDEAHFIRTFKESRGITPGEFRRLHRRDVAMPR